MNKMTQQKTKSKLYIFSLQNEEGRIQKVITGDNYDQTWLLATAEAKSMRGYWTAHDALGRFIDGNFLSNVTK